jgi:non-homologous end joining protein Ku
MDLQIPFIYTDNHIRNVLILQLTCLRNLYESRDNDSSQIYVDQIDEWQQTLKMNEDLKEQNTFIENRSFISDSFQDALIRLLQIKRMKMKMESEMPVRILQVLAFHL